MPGTRKAKVSGEAESGAADSSVDHGETKTKKRGTSRATPRVTTSTHSGVTPQLTASDEFIDLVARLAATRWLRQQREKLTQYQTKQTTEGTNHEINQ